MPAARALPKVTDGYPQMKSIVVTTINPPSPAVRAFAALPDYRVIAVGDRKTPANWESDNVRFLSVTEQLDRFGPLAAQLPFNHYSRKMLGYLLAMPEADEIIDTDDDNVPLDGFSFPERSGTFDRTDAGLGFINAYSLFTEQRIWPRGLPLDELMRDTTDIALSHQTCSVAVWQGLADGDPDVDAIYRLTSNAPCYFAKRNPVVLAEGTASPINSQNTLFGREAFPLLYLPTTVTFRFTDILRGLVAQPILWAAGLHVGFCSATVVQERNPHDYFQDFLSEIPMYQHSRRVVEVTAEAVQRHSSITQNLLRAYEALTAAGIVREQELSTLGLWLDSF